MQKKRTLILIILLFASATPVFGTTQDDGKSTNILREIGKTTGDDNPELRDDARDFRNTVGLGASAIEEFTGLKIKKHVGYLDLFLGLFKKKKKEETTNDENIQTADASDPFDSIDSSENDESEIDPSDVVGAAGIINPELAYEVAKSTSYTGKGGGAFGLNAGITKAQLGAASILKLNQQQLAVQLGEEGQQLTVAKAEEATIAMEGSNKVSEEIQTVKATQDAIKLSAKQRALQSVLTQLQVSEQQQTRLAQLQGNQTAFRVQELMEKNAWRREVNRAITNQASFRSATFFAAIYGTQDGE